MSKLIIFDLDGVLVDACEWHRVALNRALKEVCDYEISLEDHYNIFNGIPTKVKLNKLSEMGIIPIEKHKDVYDRKQALTVEIIEKGASIDKSKIEMIQTLKSKGFVVACYTNSIKKTAHLMLEKIGVKNLLDFILTNQDVTSPKPSPEGYLFLIEKFNFDIGDVIIVEDSPKGIEAAIATGCCVKTVKDATCVNINLFKEMV